jgi:hypothetical protein
MRSARVRTISLQSGLRLELGRHTRNASIASHTATTLGTRGTSRWRPSHRDVVFDLEATEEASNVDQVDRPRTFRARARKRPAFGTLPIAS